MSSRSRALFVPIDGSSSKRRFTVRRLRWERPGFRWWERTALSSRKADKMMHSIQSFHIHENDIEMIEQSVKLQDMGMT